MKETKILPMTSRTATRDNLKLDINLTLKDCRVSHSFLSHCQRSQAAPQCGVTIGVSAPPPLVPDSHTPSPIQYTVDAFRLRCRSHDLEPGEGTLL